MSFGDPISDATYARWKRFVICEHFGWTKDQYDSQPASWIEEMLVFMNTREKAQEKKET